MSSSDPAQNNINTSPTPMPTAMLMARYKCRKEVRALKIARIEVRKSSPCVYPIDGTSCGYPMSDRMHVGSDDPIIPPAGRHQYDHGPGGDGREGLLIHPTEEGYIPFMVDAEYVRKHNPQIGGYYVVYEDGYKSFSPAKAFEEGYSPIQGEL